MFRLLPYTALFLTATLSQIFIFDNLALSVYVAPLVYVVFIILMPLQSSQIMMLGSGVALGVVMDAFMGTQGLNSIATIFIAYFRAPLINMLVGKGRAVERGAPSEVIFGDGDYLRYLALMVGLHHLVFFAFESLTLSHILYISIRCVASSLVSILFVWLIARFFLTNKILK